MADQQNPIGWIEIPMTDVERAKKFYETVFQLELKRNDIMEFEVLWFPYHPDKFGASGALMKGMGYVPNVNGGGPVTYFATHDLDGVLSRVEQAGGTIYLPKKDIGKNGYIAWIKDSEGNVIGIHMFKQE